MHNGFPKVPGKTFFLSRGERPVFRRYRRDKRPGGGGSRDYHGEYDTVMVPVVPLEVWTSENLPGGEAFDTWVAEQQRNIGACDVYFVHGWINATVIRTGDGKCKQNKIGDPYHPAFSFFVIPKEFELILDRGQP